MSSSSSIYVNEEGLENANLYMNLNLYPTIDRDKPLFRPSTVYVQNGGCDTETAEWQCLPMALSHCEALYSSTGFAEDYLQCLDDRFTNCRHACGCNYQFNEEPSDFDPQQYQSRAKMVSNACRQENMEFPSQQAYQNCVDRVDAMIHDGITNLPANRFGPVSNFNRY